MTGLSGSITELHLVLEKRFHQAAGGGKKSFDGLGRSISGDLHMAKTE